MILGATTQALAPGRSSSFLALGGVEPYVYAVLPGGAGGTINANTGVYTAPLATTGADVIEATDANNLTAQLQTLVCTPLELICEVIWRELGLGQDRVILWDQKFNLPKDSGLVCAVKFLRGNPFGNTKRFDANGNLTQALNMKADIDINIMSRGPEARERKEEVLLALASQYAQTQQEINGFSIAKLPSSFIDLSEVDGAAIPYRFVLTISIQYLYQKTKAVDYFDTFQDPTVQVEA
jgi:hypothetical protein